MDRYPEALRAIVTQDRPLEFRRVHPSKLFERERTDASGAKRMMQFKLRERIGDAPILHQATLAYASDYGFLPTSLQPHGVSWRDPRLIIASLDHTLWLHRPFRADEWLLYVNDSPTAFGARGFVRGQVFTRNGQLVASSAQEGLIACARPSSRVTPEIATGLAFFAVFLFSTTLHEAAHAWAALRGGDPTAYAGGQVSLDPMPHIRREPFGMIVLPLLTSVTIGWPMGYASAPYDRAGR